MESINKRSIMSETELLEHLKTEELGEKSLFYNIKKAFTVAKYQFKFIFTYKLHIVLTLMSIVFDIGIYFFLEDLVWEGELEALNYGDRYLLFAILGVTISRYLWSAMARISHQTHHAYIDGYFEATTGTRAGVHSWMIGLAIYGFTWGSLWLLATLVIGTIAGLPLVLTPATLFVSILAIILSVVVHSGIGLVIAGVSILYKRLDPVVFILTSVFSLFGGVMYPYSVLGRFSPVLYTISQVIPFTHGLAITRLAFGGGVPFSSQVLYHFLCLLPFLVFVPLGIKSVDYFYDETRARGGLQNY